MELTLLFEGRELAAAGERVSAITLDSNVVLFVGPQREHEFRIENDLMLTGEDVEVTVHYDPYSGNEPAPKCITDLARIVGCRISHAYAYTDGVLSLLFDDVSNTALTVRPKSHYEAWTYTFGNFILSCPPGGKLTGRP